MMYGSTGRREGDRILFRAVFFLIASILPLLSASAQLPTDRLAPGVLDSTTHAKTDSLDHADSLGARAPAHTHLSLRDYGAPLGSITLPAEQPGYSFITKRDMVWERYATSFDLLRNVLPAYPLSQGVPGLVRAFSYAGAAPAAISTLYNGRPLSGLGGNGYDLELYPTEYAERIEVVRGARAAIFGSGESLIALNFVQPRYNAEGSYGRFWYYQAPGNTTSADLTYARNVGDRGNLSLGFRRIPSEGAFPQNNQKVSSWSARGTLRWEYSDALTLSLTELFSDATRGMNGGLLPESSTSPFLSEVYNDTLQERTLRHDLTLSSRWYPAGMIEVAGDTTGRKIVDTNYRLDGALYYTYAERELQTGDEPTAIPGATGFLGEGIVGARLGGDLLSDFAKVRFNANAEFVARTERFYLGPTGIESSPGDLFRFDLGGLLEATPFARAGFLSSLAVSGGAKYYSDGTSQFLTIAGEGAIPLTDSLALRGTLRSTFRIVGEDDCSAWYGLFDGTARYLTMYGPGQLIEVAAQWKEGVARVELGGYLRRGVAVACLGIEDLSITGADLRVAIPLIYSLVWDSHLIGTFAPPEDRFTPLLYGTSELYGQWTLIGGNLDLRLGTSLEFQSQPGFTRFDNLSGEFYVSAQGERPTAPPPPQWGAYAQGRIGSAYLRLEIRNILNTTFYTVDRYPTFGQGIYLGFNWALID